jgi:iron(III) transport system permease protein
MSEAVTGANIAPAQPLHIKRTSKRWLIAATLITIVVALPGHHS